MPILAPRPAKVLAIPKLIPLPPPVTKTVFPEKRSRGRISRPTKFETFIMSLSRNRNPAMAFSLRRFAAEIGRLPRRPRFAPQLAAAVHRQRFARYKSAGRRGELAAGLRDIPCRSGPHHRVRPRIGSSRFLRIDFPALGAN